MNEFNENPETKRIDPTEATNAEEFDVAAKARHNELRLGMIGSESSYSEALELAAGSSVDEIKKKIADQCDEEKKLSAYRDAVLGDKNYDLRDEIIACKKSEWEDAVQRRAYYDMALDAKTGSMMHI